MGVIDPKTGSALDRCGMESARCGNGSSRSGTSPTLTAFGTGKQRGLFRALSLYGGSYQVDRQRAEGGRARHGG